MLDWVLTGLILYAAIATLVIIKQRFVILYFKREKMKSRNTMVNFGTENTKLENQLQDMVDTNRKLHGFYRAMYSQE